MLSPSPTPISFHSILLLLLSLPLALYFTITTTTFITTTTPTNTTTTTPLILPTTDTHLFALAAHSNPHPHPTTPKKIAFLFLTTTPLPLAPLLHIFFRHHEHLFNIYVHSHPPFSGPFSPHIIPSSKPTRRASPSLISAARRLLAHALLHDPSNAFFALLSPSCIPLHSFPFTYTTLLSSNKSFIEILAHEPGIHDRYAARGPTAMLPEIPFHEFRVGSQFFVLTRHHSVLAVKDKRLWSKFKLPCRDADTCYPEEHYFPTLLSMEDPEGCVPATVTHVDWVGRHDGHPRTYVAEEVGPELIESMRRDKLRYGDTGTWDVDGNGTRSGTWEGGRGYPFLFARKFLPDTLEPLMNIASDVLFKD